MQIQMEQAGLGRINLFIGVNEPQDSAVWVPGMAFDPNLPVEKSIQLYPDLEKLTLEEAAGYLQKVSAFLREKGHDFTSVGLFDTDDEHTVMLSDIPVEQIEKPGFWIICGRFRKRRRQTNKQKKGRLMPFPQNQTIPQRKKTLLRSGWNKMGT